MTDDVKYIETSSNKCEAAWNIKQYTEHQKQIQIDIDPNTFNEYFKNSVAGLNPTLFVIPSQMSHAVAV